MRSFLTTGIRAPGSVSLLIFFGKSTIHVNSNFVNSEKLVSVTNLFTEVF